MVLEQIAITPAERRAAVLGAIASARRRLILSLFRCDDFAVVDALIEALGRGVRVEALMTERAKGGRKRLDRIASALESSGAVLHRYGDAVVKYHAKYIVADGRLALVGSANWTRKCLGETCDFILTTTDRGVARALEQLFASDCDGPGAPGAMRHARLIVGPEHARERLAALLGSARRRIDIIDPKLDDPGMRRLLDERKADGVRVTWHGRRRVGGRPAHGKLIVVDGRAAAIGSPSLCAMHLGFRRELAVITENPRVLRALNSFLHHMKTASAALLLLAAATPAFAQTTEPKSGKPGIEFTCKDQPSIKAGVFRLDVHAKLQSDFRTADQDLENEGGTYETAQKRIGISGRITDHVQFEVERELRERNPWRDVYVNVDFMRALEVRAGKFKMPFSYDELTSVARLDFAYRSLLAQTIAPARDIGVMVHGEVWRRILSYQGGVFRHDGENARIREPLFLIEGEPEPKAERSVALRLTAEPLRHASGDRELRRLFVGFAYSQSNVPEGLNSLRGQSLFGTEIAERMYVLGDRRRIGTEVIWMPGPFSVKTEYARSMEERKRQGILDDDISDFVTSAWYVSGTWAITGERKNDNIDPEKPLLQGGFGAVELAARYERISYASALKEGLAFANPRADPLLKNAETALTLGVNWYLNKWGKIVVNGIREEFDDPERTPIPGRTTNWAAVLRLQFAM